MKRALNFFFACFLALSSTGRTTPFEDGNALFREGKFDAADISRAFSAGGLLQAELDWLFEADAEARFAGTRSGNVLKEEERRRVLDLLGKLV